ncbi:MAG: DoxX family protein [Gammaproteobacteria bacterium]|nr:DoxX family protein [Gammaproteobacteria bacterium]MXW06884.1 DoxX family protein [Gammaproteobacteria bacterium]MYC25624.1 DoxX family protein [Gammaproteobacteria bacterium]
MVRKIVSTVEKGYSWFLGTISHASGLPLLALRIYLFPNLLQAGWRKFAAFEYHLDWFGDSLGLPFPWLMVVLAGLAEFGGAILLLMGWFTRLVAIPLMITMLVAAFLVHGDKGWLTTSDATSWLAGERVIEADKRRDEINDIVREHGNYRELTRFGRITMLTNGMQLAITYFVMLLVLFFFGGGRYVSVDYWLSKGFNRWKVTYYDRKQNQT